MTRDVIVDALIDERGLVQKGMAYDIVESYAEDAFYIFKLRPAKSRGRSSAIDEAVEGSRVTWGKDFEGAGYIKFADSSNDRIAVRPLSGGCPGANTALRLYQPDFLTPIIDMWQGPLAAKAMRRLKATVELVPVQEGRALSPAFADLRERQAQAIQLVHHRTSLVVGPPGTGKTHTVGATVAHLLTRFSKARILLVGPTNVAVDSALLSADDWLQRMDRADLAASMKRLGTNFDTEELIERPHLLAPGVAESARELLALEVDEPPKSNVAAYARWIDRVQQARAALKSDVALAINGSRLVATTTASAFRLQDELLGGQPWNFVICDEASQVPLPAAAMLTTMGHQILFAGDPHQLAPIVQSETKTTRRLLEKTAFDVFKSAPTVRLNEQSRMAHAIGDAIGTVFYGGDLRVCKKARIDEEWKRHRSVYFVDGRELPRICFDEVDEPAQWSETYGGFIRFRSAELIKKIVDELMGSYADREDILVLTPFRAQRTLIRLMLTKNGKGIDVSTIHRAQGSERKIVVFDPVDAASKFFEGSNGRRLINVAISRAQAHVIIPFHTNDLQNEVIRRLHEISSKLWQRPGRFARPFSFVHR